ncbi:MAG: outer membrane beta-barrel protein [Hyphomicrobiaceae bacterium]
MKFALPAFRRCQLLAALCTPLGIALPSPAPAQGYVSRYAPPSGGLRPIDQSPRSDLPIYKPPIWEGLYFGAHLGGETIALSVQDFALDRMRGVAGGLHVGYNLQYRNMVGGLELDVGTSGAAISGSVANTLRAELAHDWMASLRIRAGYAAGPMLVYGTVGYAVTNFAAQGSIGAVSAYSDVSMNGIVLGGGIEMKLSQSISGRIEALHYHYFDKVLLTGAGASISANGSSDTIRAGLTYHFN